MSQQTTLEQLEQQVAQLPLHAQLKLIAHISERLSLTTQTTPAALEEESLEQMQEKESATTQGVPLSPTRPQSADTLNRLIGLVAIGGDALADSEALYDADWH